MKRDMELVRKLLLEIEARTWAGGRKQPEIDGYDSETIAGHLKIMAEAGLIDANNASSSGGPYWIPRSLTWSGHDFLDAAREDSRWKKAVQIVKDKAGTVAFETFKALLTKLAHETLGLG